MDTYKGIGTTGADRIPGKVNVRPKDRTKARRPAAPRVKGKRAPLVFGKM
jgi:hypothetical protein